MDTNSNVPEDARVSIGVAIAVWGATVVGAAASGLFEKFAFEETIGLAAFAAAFALATYFLDASVRALVDSLRYRAAIAAALGLGLAFAWPNIPAVIFGLPLAAVFAATALARREAPKVRSAAAKSPGARPAAT
jgi:hypothetical protein